MTIFGELHMYDMFKQFVCYCNMCVHSTILFLHVAIFTVMLPVAAPLQHDNKIADAYEPIARIRSVQNHTYFERFHHAYHTLFIKFNRSREKKNICRLNGFLVCVFGIPFSYAKGVGSEKWFVFRVFFFANRQIKLFQC